jgi:hypothetical protein
MSAGAPLTEDEVKKMAIEWYEKLDVHAPMVEILPMLGDEELNMVFPEATLEGQAGFEGWYQTVIRLFFDEVHELGDFDVEIKGDTAYIKLVVHWQASRWNPPARFSDRIDLDAYQTWEVKRSNKSGLPVVTKYVVDELRYREGSAEL